MKFTASLLFLTSLSLTTLTLANPSPEQSTLWSRSTSTTHQLTKRCPPFDPAGTKNVGNGKAGQFIGGQCLSNADCASNCCALPCGICSGPGAAFQAGKQGCGFSSSSATNSAANSQASNGNAAAESNGSSSGSANGNASSNQSSCNGNAAQGSSS